MQQVVNLWDGLSPGGGTGWQHKWIPEGFGQTGEWQSRKGVLQEAEMDSMWSGVRVAPRALPPRVHGVFVDKSPGLVLSQ